MEISDKYEFVEIMTQGDGVSDSLYLYTYNESLTPSRGFIKERKGKR